MNSSSVTRCVSRCSAAFAATFRNAFMSIEGLGISLDFCAETAKVANAITARANANFCFIENNPPPEVRSMDALLARLDGAGAIDPVSLRFGLGYYSRHHQQSTRFPFMRFRFQLTLGLTTLLCCVTLSAAADITGTLTINGKTFPTLHLHALLHDDTEGTLPSPTQM